MAQDRGTGAILVVDKNPSSRRAMADLLESEGYRVQPATCGLDALSFVSSHPVEVILTDLELADMPGIEILRRAKRLRPEIPVIIVSPHRKFAAVREVVREGALDYLTKPPQRSELLPALGRAVETYRNRRAAAAAEREAERRLADLVLLKAIGETASSGEDLQPLFDLILDSITESLQVETASLMVLDEDGHLVIRAARGLPTEILDTVSAVPGQGVAGQVLLSGLPALVDDITYDERFVVSEFFTRYQTRSLLSVPLKVREGVIGVLNVNNKRSGETFTSDDQNLLTTIAHQASLAIENFRLVSDLRRQARELEEANRHLLKLHQDRSRLVCNLSHELNTPLTSVLGYVDLILHSPGPMEEAERRDHLLKVYAEGQRMESIVSGMLRLFSIDSGEGGWNPESLALPPLLETALAFRRRDMADKHLAVDLFITPGLPEIHGDREKVMLMLDALLDNAVKFNRPGGKITVEADLMSGGPKDHLRLRIRNDGLVVPQEAGPGIFESFTQLGDMNTGKPPGVGIGLAICKAIVEKMKGTIELDPSAGEGTTLCLRLPFHETCGESYAPEGS